MSSLCWCTWLAVELGGHVAEHTQVTFPKVLAVIVCWWKEQDGLWKLCVTAVLLEQDVKAYGLWATSGPQRMLVQFIKTGGKLKSATARDLQSEARLPGMKESSLAS